MGVAPPLVGVAVNVNDSPEQAGLFPEVRAIKIDGLPVGFTVMVISLLAVEVGKLQIELTEQSTTSPSASVVDVYVALFVPTLIPFTCH